MRRPCGPSATRRAPRRRVVWATILMAAAALAVVGCGSEPYGELPGTEVFRGDYETGDTSQWPGAQSVRDDSIAIVEDMVREGDHAARFEVRSGENPIGFGDRAEVQSATDAREGDERFYAWSTMLASDFPRYTDFQVLAQWHAEADGPPPLAFYAEGDDLVLRANRHAAPGELLDIVDLWRGPLRRGEWQDLKLHVKWSADDRVGFVELWVDGVMRSLDSGSRRRYVRAMYPGFDNYFKQGLYRESGLPRPGVVYHDGLRVTEVQPEAREPYSRQMA